MHCRHCGNPVNDDAVVCLSCGAPPLAASKFCQTCGAETHPAAVICVKCGVPLRTAAQARPVLPGGPAFAPDGRKLIVASDPPKDPILMAVLSGCCIAFLGQIILGQTTKGIVMILVTIVVSLITVGGGVVVMFPLAAVDAYLIAKKLKDGRSVGEWEFF